MKLETFIQSEASQKEKHQYSVLTLEFRNSSVFIYIYIEWNLERW